MRDFLFFFFFLLVINNKLLFIRLKRREKTDVGEVWTDSLTIFLETFLSCVNVDRSCPPAASVRVREQRVGLGGASEQLHWHSNKQKKWDLTTSKNQQCEPKHHTIHHTHTRTQTHTGTNWCCRRTLLRLAALPSRSNFLVLSACLYFYFSAINWEVLLLFSRLYSVSLC